ncbi:MAG TPA: hypothetical protein VK826_17775 [Bacteroidia bacterium]|nr:hypothetical protein [Bacteroidia bacterium]
MKDTRSNFERMLALVNEVFETRSDPSQLQVDQHQIEKLQQVHPATLSEYNEGQGPLVWILLIPTTTKVMNDFISGTINENELLERTNPRDAFEAIYLCSATVLPEYRRKKLAEDLCIKAINDIRKDYAIKALYVWPFTDEGMSLAEKIAAITQLKLRVKK